MSDMIIKIMSGPDREARPHPAWHLVTDLMGQRSVLCSGEIIGDQHQSYAYQLKKIEDGRLTCQVCISLLNEIAEPPLDRS